MIISIGVVILAIIFNPENICRKASGFNWLFLVAPFFEIIILVTMFFLVIFEGKNKKSNNLDNWLKIAIVLVITYMITDAGICAFIRYSTKKIQKQNKEKIQNKIASGDPEQRCDFSKSLNSK